MTGARRRRHNAPIHPRRKATIVPDILVALGTAACVMGGGFVVASFTDDDVTASDAGRQLAWLFAGVLCLAGAVTLVLAVGLLRETRTDPSRYVLPLAVGAAIGAMEAALFLSAAGILLLAPFALLVIVLHPVHRRIVRLFHHQDGHSG